MKKILFSFMMSLACIVHADCPVCGAHDNNTTALPHITLPTNLIFRTNKIEGIYPHNNELRVIRSSFEIDWNTKKLDEVGGLDYLLIRTKTTDTNTLKLKD